MGEKLGELLASVEAATAPDRALDAAVQAALRVQSPSLTAPWVENWTGPWEAKGDRVFLMHSDGSHGPNFAAMPLTASIDAALALVERVLPRALIEMHLDRDNSSAILRGGPGISKSTIGHNEREDRELSLAIVAALLKALIAQAALTPEPSHDH